MTKRILCVDDSTTLRKSVLMALDVIDVEIIEAEDGVIGLETLEKEKGKFDLILLDWFMPNMNGQQFLEAVKADTRYKTIPVVMLTTATDKIRMIQAIRTGAKHYLTKPFTQEDLLIRVVQVLQLEL
ncbi:MAG: response regulator [Candidatus Cloacimonadota bacterium]|nr:MAG: response regulator [Candidatus Cloacimonadota bacterium]